MDSFNSDLSVGEYIERLVLKWIRTKYPLAYKVEGKFSGYDIWIPDFGGIEVKYDEKVLETKNIVVEFEFGGNPSALAVTTAELWITVTPKTLAIYYPERLAHCISENHLRSCEFTARGDRKPKRAYLIKEEMMEEYAMARIDISTSNQ
jgi:hypothetical protein